MRGLNGHVVFSGGKTIKEDQFFNIEEREIGLLNRNNVGSAGIGFVDSLDGKMDLEESVGFIKKEEEEDIEDIEDRIIKYVETLPEFNAIAQAIEMYAIQKQQAEDDLIKIGILKERYLKNPQLFIDDYNSGKMKRFPKSQRISTLPNLDSTQYIDDLKKRGISGHQKSDDLILDLSPYPTLLKENSLKKNIDDIPMSISRSNSINSNLIANPSSNVLLGINNPLNEMEKRGSQYSSSSVNNTDSNLKNLDRPASSTASIITTASAATTVVSASATTVPNVTGTPIPSPLLEKPKKVTKPRVSGTFYINSTGSINVNSLLNNTKKDKLGGKKSKSKKKDVDKKELLKKNLSVNVNSTDLDKSTSFVNDLVTLDPELNNSNELKELKKLQRLQESTLAMHVSDTVHHGFACDGCFIEPIVGNRWSCVTCKNDFQSDFDLCDECHEKTKQDGFVFDTDVHKAANHRFEKAEDVITNTSANKDSSNEFNYLGL